MNIPALGTEIVNIGLVVLIVMDAHCLFIDVRLKRVVVVIECGYLVWHCCSLARVLRFGSVSGRNYMGISSRGRSLAGAGLAIVRCDAASF